MFEPLLIVLSGLLDRIRGDGFHFFNRAVDKFLYGWVIAALFGHPFDILTVPIAIAMMLGMSPGWGDTMGAFLRKTEISPTYDRHHWWQTAWMKKSKWVSGIVRGLIWGAPVAALSFFDPILIWALPIFLVAYIGSLLFTAYFVKGDWGHAETIRGLMGGAMIALATNFDAIITWVSMFF